MIVPSCANAGFNAASDSGRGVGADALVALDDAAAPFAADLDWHDPLPRPRFPAAFARADTRGLLLLPVDPSSAFTLVDSPIAVVDHRPSWIIVSSTRCSRA